MKKQRSKQKPLASPAENAIRLALAELEKITSGRDTANHDFVQTVRQILCEK